MVSNACGILSNLSARCQEDQKRLRDLGAVPMLRSLVHSRHKTIAAASSAALKNLDSSTTAFVSGSSPITSAINTSFQVRKQKALEQEIDEALTEMCDSIMPDGSTSLSSLHNNDQVIVGAQLFSPTSKAVGHLAERNAGAAVEIEPAAIPAAPEPDSVPDEEWSDECGSDDDHLLEDIIMMGMPLSRQKELSQSSTKPKAVSQLDSAYNLGQKAHPPELSVPSPSIGSSFRSKGIQTDPQSDGGEEDDDELLFACISSGKPVAKPPPSKSSLVALSDGKMKKQSRQSRLVLELPKPPACKERHMSRKYSTYAL